MKPFFNLLGKNKIIFILTLIIGVFFSSVGVISPVISGKLITAVTTNSKYSIVLLISFLLISLVKIIFSELDQYFSSILKIYQKRYMRQCVFKSFLKISNAEKNDISDIGSFINNDIPSISEHYVVGTIDIIKCIWIILISIISLVTIHWALAIIIVSVSIMIVIVPNIFRKKSGENRKVYSENLSEYNNILNSFSNGINQIRIYKCSGYIENNIEKYNENISRSELSMLNNNLLVYGASATLQVLKTVIILLVGIYLAIYDKIGIGDLVAVIQISEIIGSPIEILAYLRHKRNEVVPIVKKYEKMLSIDKKSNKGYILSNTLNDLRMDKVSYNVKNQKILNNLSLKFRAGGKYIISGESGSGKSSILRIIANIEKVYDGNVFYGVDNIKEIAEEYYGKVAMVTQEPYLFYMSLKENIVLGRDIDSEIYNNTIEKLNLKYLIDRYEDKDINPEIMEKLSGGEKQRITLARAMVGKPNIYLLDEVTAALDHENAKIVEKLFLEEESTVIQVSHKLSSELISKYDQVYILKAGSLTTLKV